MSFHRLAFPEGRKAQLVIFASALAQAGLVTFGVALFSAAFLIAGLNRADWTPRELRHSFVSLLSDDGVPLEAIADLVGHAGTSVTEKVYRRQLRAVLLTGAVAMDRIFPAKG